MLRKLILLRDEIEEELANIYQLQNYLQDIKAQKLDSEINRRVFASVLSDFYMALERIFKIIAREIDAELPGGEDWHKKLLRQMSVELPEIRPAVFDKKLYYNLEEYLKFRHLVRNIYGFQLEYARFAHLVDQMGRVVSKLKEQLTKFFDKMQDIAQQL